MTVTSVELCEHLGISYRQLDYLARTGTIPDDARGSGSRRRFDIDVVHRLTVARTLAGAMPESRGVVGGQVWFAIVRAVMAGPLPPADGFAVLYGETIRYFPIDVPVAAPVGSLIVRYRVDQSFTLSAA